MNSRTRRTAAWAQALLVVLTLSGAFAVMAAGYAGRLNAVTLVVDGEPRTIRTNQTTVEGVLRDAGITLDPRDRVQPSPSQALASDGIVRISRARPVTIVADERALTVRTHARSVFELLSEQHVALGPNDALLIDGDSAPAASTFSGPPTTPHTVSILRAVPLAVTFDDGPTQTIFTTQPTIGRALNAAGINIYLADRLTPVGETPVGQGGTVHVERAIPVAVHVDGQSIHTRTHRERVGDLLAEMGVALQGLDFTQPPLDAAVSVDLTVRVVRVSQAFQIEQEAVAFVSQVLPNPDREIDTQELAQEGENGVLQKRIRVRYEDGQEVSRQVEDQVLVRAPRPRVTTYGTRIVVRTIQTSDGPRDYWRHFRVLATSYSASTAGVPKSNPHYGRTALGWPMRKGIVAIDPKIIPFRTEMYVPGYGVGVAGDTGGAIIGRHIDLGYDDDNLVIWYRWVDVYLLTPVPPGDSIAYMLPNWPIERR